PENDAFNDILIRGIQERETRLYQEVPFRRRDGRLLDLAVTTSFLRIEDGKWDIPGIVAVFKDITEFKALDRARRRVLDHLSHELRTPLSIIAGSLKTLETPPGKQRAIERLTRNLKRLQDIQMEVEDIVRTRTPAHLPSRNIDLQALRVSPSIERAAAMIQGLSSHRHVGLKIEVREDPYALIDEAAVEKALMSLVKNAIENTPDGGTVTVSLERSTDGVALRVRDTGVGITEESRKQIFGGFYHARETDFYSTKKPFDFDAGGKSLELLKLRMFADAYRFRVACESTRCIHLSGEDATCPGVISECSHVQDAAECARAGGTAFTLVFPIAPNP
ncbi:MAG: domain S-box protein, partial [Thermodesulfobacteriota bacterium]|nr:domain S-box protein [Thermodesulfobacteriota bacterium]